MTFAFLIEAFAKCPYAILCFFSAMRDQIAAIIKNECKKKRKIGVSHLTLFIGSYL